VYLLADAPVFELGGPIRFSHASLAANDTSRIIHVPFLAHDAAAVAVAEANRTALGPLAPDVLPLLQEDARFRAYAAVRRPLHEAQRQLEELEREQAPTRLRLAHERQALQENPGQAAALGRRLAKLDA
jgi:hypothetical protein